MGKNYEAGRKWELEVIYYVFHVQSVALHIHWVVVFLQILGVFGVEKEPDHTSCNALAKSSLIGRSIMIGIRFGFQCEMHRY